MTVTLIFIPHTHIVRQDIMNTHTHISLFLTLLNGSLLISSLASLCVMSKFSCFVIQDTLRSFFVFSHIYKLRQYIYHIYYHEIQRFYVGIILKFHRWEKIKQMWKIYNFNFELISITYLNRCRIYWIFEAA